MKTQKAKHENQEERKEEKKSVSVKPGEIKMHALPRDEGPAMMK
jgi:hypothetical protein